MSTPFQAAVDAPPRSKHVTIRVSTTDDSGEELVVARLAISGPLRRSCQSHGWKIAVPSGPVSDCQVLPVEPVDWTEILTHVQAELQRASDELAAWKEARHRLVVDAQQSGISLAVAGEAMGLTRMRISQIRRRQ